MCEVAETTKVCFKCGECRPLSDFYKHPRMADGHLNKCKSCTKRDVSKNRQDNQEYYKSYDKARAGLEHRVEARRAYAQTEQGKKVHTRAITKYRKEHPDRYKAQVALNNAVRDGRVIPWPVCAVDTCEESLVEAHHPDYSEPLQVVWLCKCHHNEIHKN